ncbi:MAG: tetratricopeptide repeat protein, partial [Chloroflexota bacterium]
SKSTWQPLLMLSGLYDQTGQVERAYQSVGKALEFAPDNPEVLLAAGYLAAKLNRIDDSLQRLRKLLTGKRDDGFKAQGRSVLLQLGQHSGQPAMVLEALSGEVAGTSSEECVVLRAAAQGQLGEAQAQYDTLEAGCASHPKDYAIRFALADFLGERGYDNEALNTLGAALDNPEAPAETYKRLSLLLAKLGRAEDANNAVQLYAQLVDKRAQREIALPLAG